MSTLIKKTSILLIACICGVVGIWCITAPATARITDNEFEDIVQKEVDQQQDIENINIKIEEKASEVRDLEEKIDIYKQNIDDKQQEKASLENQLSILEDKIDETKSSIEKTEIELEILQLEIETLQDQIAVAKEDIETNKERLRELIVDIYRFEQQTPLEITFSNHTFSDFFSDLEFTNRVQTNVQDTLNSVQHSKLVLEEKQGEVKDKKAEVTVQKTELESEQEFLVGEEQYKNNLLEETELSEEKYQLLLKQVRDEQSQIEGQIASLEKKAQDKITNIRTQIQEKLEEQGEEVLTEEELEILDGNVAFIWPVTGRITCAFHCGGYPFSNSIGAHNGLDIGVSMGTPIKAAASGYVTVAKFDGTSSYAWIMIAHGNKLSSVYGHVSGVAVSVDQYVRRGDIIGYTGGSPGTPGAGAYSTGPHLHFEIRYDGFPQNPQNYLP